MGIKTFSQVFTNQKDITLANLSGKTIVIDAMLEIHRAASPFGGQTYLRAKDGNITNHINTILGLIMTLKKNKVNQIWVFDSMSTTPLKADEIKRRKASKATSLEKYMCQDILFMLECLDITWVRAPPQIEGEQFAAYLTNQNINGTVPYGVMTTDADCLLFGAKNMIKRTGTKYSSYNLAEILSSYKITLQDLRKIGIILGSDFDKGTKGIGPKTVLTKFRDVQLTTKQQDALNYFSTIITPEVAGRADWHEGTGEKKKELLEWLITKGFNEKRTRTRINI